jgi:hypothetical protein
LSLFENARWPRFPPTSLPALVDLAGIEFTLGSLLPQT